jgi:hypothetical protein
MFTLARTVGICYVLLTVIKYRRKDRWGCMRLRDNDPFELCSHDTGGTQ